MTYMYDADNNRTQMIDGTGTTTYGYDALERLDSVTNGASNVVTYGYDSDGNVVCLTYPNSGSNTCQNASSGTGFVTYAYDGAGQATSMTDWLGSGNVTSFGYDRDGNLTSTILPSGTTTATTHAYDNADALTDTSYKIGSTATDLAALTPNADELIGKTTPPTGGATTYGYDPLNRITTGTTASYTYDTASEITSATPSGGSTTDYSYNSDGQLCWTASSTGSCSSPPTGATTFAYSSVGERLTTTPSGFNPTTYGWDQAGNLVCQTAPNGFGYSCSNPNSSVTTSYAYNGDGLRTSDTPAGASAQQFTWDVTGSVPQLLEDGTNYYLYGPNTGAGPLEQITISGSTPTYLVSDTTGVREQVGSTGSVVGSMSYDSYGNRCSTCSISTPFGFESAYTDSAGLVYLVHRYYDPATEQFLSVDPLTDLTGTPYSFTGGDPVNGSDPSGLSPWGWAAHQVGAFVNGIGSNLSGNGSAWCNNQIGAQRQFACSGGSAVGEVGTWISAIAGAVDGSFGEPAASDEVSALDDALVSAEADTFATKGEARSALSNLGCPEEQQAAANRAIGRASGPISVSQVGDYVVVRYLRPGYDGYQIMMSVVSSNGEKRVVQLAYNAAGKMVHYDPKTP